MNSDHSLGYEDDDGSTGGSSPAMLHQEEEEEEEDHLGNEEASGDGENRQKSSRDECMDRLKSGRRRAPLTFN